MCYIYTLENLKYIRKFKNRYKIDIKIDIKILC